MDNSSYLIQIQWLLYVTRTIRIVYIPRPIRIISPINESAARNATSWTSLIFAFTEPMILWEEWYICVCLCSIFVYVVAAWWRLARTPHIACDVSLFVTFRSKAKQQTIGVCLWRIAHSIRRRQVYTFDIDMQRTAAVVHSYVQVVCWVANLLCTTYISSWSWYLVGFGLWDSTVWRSLAGCTLETKFHLYITLRALNINFGSFNVDTQT